MPHRLVFWHDIRTILRFQTKQKSHEIKNSKEAVKFVQFNVKRCMCRITRISIITAWQTIRFVGLSLTNCVRGSRISGMTATCLRHCLASDGDWRPRTVKSVLEDSLRTCLSGLRHCLHYHENNHCSFTANANEALV